VGQASQDDPIPEFEALLTQAIGMHDWATMRSLMGDSFGLAFWQSEGLTISPGQAIEQLRLNYLLPGNTIRFQEGPDLSPQLGGNDILSIWDPAVNPVRALYGLGWGMEGNDEAFLIIAQRPDGTLYWYAMLMTSPGFADRAVEHPAFDPSVRISPLSGPPGTLVQVIASDFGPYAPLSVAVGPANSEFVELARGKANADGVFLAQVPAQGAPGMNLVFAVSADGRPGVLSPEMFQITAVPAPRVSIWPLRGPSGTLVQVTASGFPPSTPVSVGVGPADSQFGEVAQGRTDAYGAFVVQVPVQGQAGMSLVFAVAAAGQPAVTAPHLFQITGPVVTVIPTPVPVLTPTPTPYVDMWTTFSSSVYAISLQYPADWQPIPGYGDPETDEARYGAINGFFQISAMDSDSMDAAAAAEAEHKLQPYGSAPKIETLQIQGQEARLILPSGDQPAGMQHQAALIVRYPEPVNISGTPCRFFVLWADWPHIRTIGQTLQFAR
jgi:TolB protein